MAYNNKRKLHPTQHMSNLITAARTGDHDAFAAAAQRAIQDHGSMGNFIHGYAKATNHDPREVHDMLMDHARESFGEVEKMAGGGTLADDIPSWEQLREQDKKRGVPDQGEPAYRQFVEDLKGVAARHASEQSQHAQDEGGSGQGPNPPPGMSMHSLSPDDMNKELSNPQPVHKSGIAKAKAKKAGPGDHSADDLNRQEMGRINAPTPAPQSPKLPDSPIPNQQPAVAEPTPLPASTPPAPKEQSTDDLNKAEADRTKSEKPIQGSAIAALTKSKPASADDLNRAEADRINSANKDTNIQPTVRDTTVGRSAIAALAGRDNNVTTDDLNNAQASRISDGTGSGSGSGSGGGTGTGSGDGSGGGSGNGSGDGSGNGSGNGSGSGTGSGSGIGAGSGVGSGTGGGGVLAGLAGAGNDYGSGSGGDGTGIKSAPDHPIDDAGHVNVRDMTTGDGSIPAMKGNDVPPPEDSSSGIRAALNEKQDKAAQQPDMVPCPCDSPDALPHDQGMKMNQDKQEALNPAPAAGAKAGSAPSSSPDKSNSSPSNAAPAAASGSGGGLSSFGKALMRLGLGMAASNSKYFGQAVGIGGLQALNGYDEDRSQEQKLKYQQAQTQDIQSQAKLRGIQGDIAQENQRFERENIQPKVREALAQRGGLALLGDPVMRSDGSPISRQAYQVLSNPRTGAGSQGSAAGSAGSQAGSNAQKNPNGDKVTNPFQTYKKGGPVKMEGGGPPYQDAGSDDSDPNNQPPDVAQGDVDQGNAATPLADLVTSQQAAPPQPTPSQPVPQQQAAPQAADASDAPSAPPQSAPQTPPPVQQVPQQQGQDTAPGMGPRFRPMAPQADGKSDVPSDQRHVGITMISDHKGDEIPAAQINSGGRPLQMGMDGNSIYANGIRVLPYQKYLDYGLIFSMSSNPAIKNLGEKYMDLAKNTLNNIAKFGVIPTTDGSYVQANGYVQSMADKKLAESQAEAQGKYPYEIGKVQVEKGLDLRNKGVEKDLDLRNQRERQGLDYIYDLGKAAAQGDITARNELIKAYNNAQFETQKKAAEAALTPHTSTYTDSVTGKTIEVPSNQYAAVRGNAPIPFPLTVGPGSDMIPQGGPPIAAPNGPGLPSSMQQPGMNAPGMNAPGLNQPGIGAPAGHRVAELGAPSPVAQPQQSTLGIQQSVIPQLGKTPSALQKENLPIPQQGMIQGKVTPGPMGAQSLTSFNKYLEDSREKSQASDAILSSANDALRILQGGTNTGPGTQSFNNWRDKIVTAFRAFGVNSPELEKKVSDYNLLHQDFGTVAAEYGRILFPRQTTNKDLGYLQSIKPNLGVSNPANQMGIGLIKAGAEYQKEKAAYAQKWMQNFGGSNPEMLTQFDDWFDKAHPAEQYKSRVFSVDSNGQQHFYYETSDQKQLLQWKSELPGGTIVQLRDKQHPNGQLYRVDPKGVYDSGM